MSQTILIIEDDRRIANWLKVYFERAGFAADVALSGEAGLSAAHSLGARFDCAGLNASAPRWHGGLQYIAS